jgi:hypothetical protein
MEIATYLNDITVTKTVKLYKVQCPKCGSQFIIEKTADYNIQAIPCKYCDCAFNVSWQ